MHILLHNQSCHLELTEFLFSLKSISISSHLLFFSLCRYCFEGFNEVTLKSNKQSVLKGVCLGQSLLSGSTLELPMVLPSSQYAK